MSRRSHLALKTAALAGLLSVLGCASTEESEEVVALIRNGRFDEAVQLASDRVEAAPDDPEAERQHLDATLAWMLEEGRRDVFEGRFEDALDWFNEALALSPENEAVLSWLRKTREELTAQWLTAGSDYILRDDLQGALESYQLALYYSPESDEALLGTSRVLLLMNYRQGMGDEYYNQGVRAVYSHIYTVARGKFQKVNKYLPGHERAADRMEFVESALAEERNFVATGFERDGRFGAAMNEYRLVLLLDPGNATAADGFDRMELEVKAMRLLSQADKLIRQARFEEALLMLEEGASITKQQTDQFTRLVNEIEVAHWESMYQEGINLEQDFLYEDAIAAFDQLLGEAEFYQDAASRKETLEEYVGRAAGLYAEYQATDDPAQQLNALRQIEVFWPEYLDLPELLKAFRDQGEL